MKRDGLTSCTVSGFQMSHQALVLKYYSALHSAGFFARPAHQSFGKPIRVIPTSRPYKSSRANMSLLNCHSLPPCLLHPLRSQTNWNMYELTHKSAQMKWIITCGKRAASPHFALSVEALFFFLLKSSSDSNLKQQPTPQTFGSAHRGVPSEDLLPVSCKSAHEHCCGWWSVLSPSLPHWSNWKRKVPPLWISVQVALSVCQSTGCEQLINNYCFYVLPQGQGCNLQQEEGFEWIWCLNYCWNIVTAYRFNCLSVRSLFHLDGRQLLCLHCLLIQQCGQYCDVCFPEFLINEIINTIYKVLKILHMWVN